MVRSCFNDLANRSSFHTTTTSSFLLRISLNIAFNAGASAGNRVKTSGSSIKHVELETLKYVSSGYGRYLPDFVLYSTHEPCAMCAGACVWSKIGAVVFGVSQEDITAYGKKHGTEEFKWRACLISCKFVLEKGDLHIPVFDNFLRLECRKLFGYRAS
jgi:tRNA(adenine34) deaminase